MNKTLDKNLEMKDSGVEWIGKIPKGWEVRRFSSCISKSNAGEVIPKEFWGKGCELLYTCAKEPLFSNYEGFPEDKRTQKGNLLLTRNGTPYIHMPKLNSIYSNVVQRVILEKDNSSFIRYALIQGSKSIIGNGDIIESFNMGKWNSTSIPLPSLYEQQAIANYLDEQVLKIDELIAEQKQSIEGWKAYKQSLITEKVTKGLNLSIDMKDSGIEWIGWIPREWKVIRVKNEFKAIKRVVGQEVDKYERLALTLNGVIKRSKEDAEGLQPEKFEGYQILKENELVFKLIDLENLKTSRVGLSAYCGLVSPAYIILTNDSHDNRFSYYYFMSLYYGAIFNSLGGDGVRSALNKDDLLNIPYVCPPIHEQQDIANYLDEKCSKFDQMIEQKQVFIKQLEEYKQSLIYECVTGKRCVL